MGKNRKSRSHRGKGPDPVGTAAIEQQINHAIKAEENDGITVKEEEEEKQDYTWRCIQQMSDPSSVQRTIACHSLAHSLTPTSIHTLTSPLLTRLLHLTIDIDMDVCVAATQAVRTITSMGIDACEKVMSCDGVTTLCGIMTHERLNRAGTTQRVPLLTHATASLFALCESFDRATSQVTSSIQTLLPVWIGHLVTYDDTMISLHIEIAQLLLLLSEENDVMVSFITSNTEIMSKLISCMTDTRHTSLVNIACAGVIIQCQPQTILMGTSPIPSSHPVATTLTSILSVIQRIMSVDPINVTTTMIQTLLPQYKNMKEQLEAIELAAHKDLDKDGKDEMADTTETKETKTDEMDDGMADDQHQHEKEIHPRKTSKPKDISPEVILQEQWQSTTESSLITWRSHITSIRTALEILTNLCTTLETEEDEEDEKEATLTVAQHAIVGAGLLQHVLERGKCTMGSITSPITPFQQEMLTHLRTLFPTDDVTSMTHLIDTLRARAHACCANLIQHLPRHVLGDINTVVTHACTLMEALSQAYTNKNATAIAEFGPLTSLIWQSLLKDSSLILTKPQFTALIQLARSGIYEEIRTHAIGCITCLGMRDAYATQNFIIGTVLLEAMSAYLSSTPSVSLDICLLACDGLMDIYSEDHVHTNAINSLQLLSKLHAFGEAFTKHMKESKLSLDKPTRARCQGVMTNLKAFLEYKKDHI